MLVRFRSHFRIWNAGEVAGFPDDIGEALVAHRIAERIDQRPPAQTRPPESPAKRVPNAGIDQKPR